MATTTLDLPTRLTVDWAALQPQDGLLASLARELDANVAEHVAEAEAARARPDPYAAHRASLVARRVEPLPLYPAQPLRPRLARPEARARNARPLRWAPKKPDPWWRRCWDGRWKRSVAAGLTVRFWDHTRTLTDEFVRHEMRPSSSSTLLPFSATSRDPYAAHRALLAAIGIEPERRRRDDRKENEQ